MYNFYSFLNRSDALCHEFDVGHFTQTRFFTLSHCVSSAQMFDGETIPVFVASFTVVAVFLLLRRFKQSGVKDHGKRYPPSLPLLRLFGFALSGGIGVLPENLRRSAEELGPIFHFKIGKRWGYFRNYSELSSCHPGLFVLRPSGSIMFKYRPKPLLRL